METTKRAADLVAEIFPAIKPRDRVKLLFNCTGHPCAGIDVVEKQLRSLAEKANGTYEGCVEASRRKPRPVDAEESLALSSGDDE